MNTNCAFLASKLGADPFLYEPHLPFLESFLVTGCCGGGGATSNRPSAIYSGPCTLPSTNLSTNAIPSFGYGYFYARTRIVKGASSFAERSVSSCLSPVDGQEGLPPSYFSSASTVLANSFPNARKKVESQSNYELLNIPQDCSLYPLTPITEDVFEICGLVFEAPGFIGTTSNRPHSTWVVRNKMRNYRSELRPWSEGRDRSSDLWATAWVDSSTVIELTRDYIVPLAVGIRYVITVHVPPNHQVWKVEDELTEYLIIFYLHP